jgi:hypothetical protein
VIARIKLFFVTAGAFLLMGLTTWLSLKRASAANAEAKEAKRDLKTVQRAQEIRDEVEILDDVGLAARASKWLHEK